MSSKDRLPGSIIYIVLLILILILVLASSSSSSMAQNRNYTEDDDDKDPARSRRPLVALGMALVPAIIGLVVFLYIRKDTIGNTMNTKRWLTVLVLMVGVFHMGGGIAATYILFENPLIAVYLMGRVLAWCLFIVLYLVFKKKAVPIMESVPEMYRAKTEKIWKTIFVFGVCIASFSIILGSIWMLFEEEYGLAVEGITIGIIGLALGFVLFKKWLTPGAVQVDREKVQEWKGKTTCVISWKEVNKVHLDIKRMHYPGSYQDAKYYRINIIGPVKTISISTQDIGEEELKRMYFVVMYYGKLSNPYLSFTFEDKLGRGWYEKFQFQLERMLPGTNNALPPDYYKKEPTITGYEKEIMNASSVSCSRPESPRRDTGSTTCPHCGKITQGHTSTCPYCFRSTDTVTTEKNCINCGNIVPGDAVACPYCSEELVTEPTRI